MLSIKNNMSKSNKKGQYTLAFNWIYVLIAGAVILLFFISIAVKQQSISEENLSYDVTRILESIITAATASEQTKNFIDTSTLYDYTFVFTCEMDEYAGGFKDIFSSYSVEGTTSSEETIIEPIFAPGKIQTTEMITWSLPYKLPFKIMDVLMITSSDTKYYVIGDSSEQEFKEEILNSTIDLNFHFIDSFDEIDPGDSYHVRIIDFDSGISGSQITDNGAVPESLKSMSDSKVSAVSFMASGGINYYQKESNHFEKVNNEVVQLISNSPGERDATKYAAMFAHDAEMYKCNMMKIFKRVEILAQIYEGKYDELVEYYSEESEYSNSECLTALGTNNPFNEMKLAAMACTSSGYEYCIQLIGYATEIEDLNELLDKEQCITVY